MVNVINELYLVKELSFAHLINALLLTCDMTVAGSC